MQIWPPIRDTLAPYWWRVTVAPYSKEELILSDVAPNGRNKEL